VSRARETFGRTSQRTQQGAVALATTSSSAASSTIAMLLVAPNVHSTTSLRLKILGFEDFDFECLKILKFHTFYVFFFFLGSF
jgi:hypothetical protein